MTSFEKRFDNAIQELEELTNRYLHDALDAAINGNREKAYELYLKQQALGEAVRILHVNMVV